MENVTRLTCPVKCNVRAKCTAPGCGLYVCIECAQPYESRQTLEPAQRPCPHFADARICPNCINEYNLRRAIDSGPDIFGDAPSPFA